MSETTSSSVCDETRVNNGSAACVTGPDPALRERVLKEVGLTSTTFIGPAFPPPTADIEDTLSEFYKELEEISTPDGSEENPVERGQPVIPPELSTRNQTQDNVTALSETDGSQKSSGQKQPWSHWYQNEPYRPRRPRPGGDVSSGRAAPAHDQWHHLHTPHRPPHPDFHRPPLHRPPPPSAFPHPQNPPPHNWSGPGVRNRCPEEPRFPTSSNFLPLSVHSHPPQDFQGEHPHHFDRDERGYSCDAHTDDMNAGWSRDRREDWCHQDFDWRPRPALRSSQVLILMRGLPGSGKSTLARELLSTGPSGLILSTDDYFVQRNCYRYEAGLLGAAHEWNQSRAKDAMHDGRSPIIIDNTNLQAWEMKPYVKMALERGYKVDFCEPDTSWKFDPFELEKRNKHGVPHEKISQMMDRFSFPISVDIVMSSQEPLHVNQRRRHEQPRMRNDH